MFKYFIFIVLFFHSILAYGETVSNIVIQGNERVEESTIKSYTDITPGLAFNNDNIDSSLKKLYASNLFQKVNLSIKNNILYIKVIENPKINLVVFEGNSKVKTKDLEAEVSLKPRAIYTKAKVQEDVNRIIDIYNKNGRFSAKVTPQIIVLPQNRVNLIYKIEEGPVAKIGKIKFIGNNAFSDSRLASELSSKETHWYYFLSSSDKFNPTRIEYDRELLTRFYQSRGYADFKIISIITNVSSRKEKFYITITLDEGAKYHIGEVNIKSELKDKSIKIEDLKSEIITKEKDVYDIKEIEKSVDAIIKRINDQGYAFVDVDPQVELNKEKKLVDLTYYIGESRRVYIDKIDIEGNVRTSDKVIRREFRLAEGDPYNATKITRSDQRINNLDYFERTNIETVRTNQPDKVDLRLKVQEKATASVNLAGGFSTTAGPLAKIGFNEPNLLGNGQDLSLSFMKSTSSFDGDIAFTEPYLFDLPLSGTVQLFHKDSQRNSKYHNYYNSRTNGIGFGVGYEITEYLHHKIYYNFAKTKISNVPDTYSDIMKEQQGITYTSLIGHGLSYDRRDSKVNPISGYIVNVNQDFAGLGGTVKFVRHTVSSKYYYPIINDDVILILAAEAGDIYGVDGKEVKIGNRFNLGGNNLRGFNYGGVGPRDKEDLAPLGGNTYYSGTSEVKFPLGFGKELGLFGAVFIDAGSLYKVDVAQRDEFWDSRKTRSSCGAGLGIVTPMGPVRINYARPMSKAFFDREKHFDIVFSTEF